MPKNISGRFIVKVQLSLATNCENRRVLVYNKARTVMFEDDAPPGLAEKMKGAGKAFFYARMSGTDIDLQGKAPSQQW